MDNKIYNDDCFNVMNDETKIKNKSVDLVLVDLPYGQIKQGWDTCINLVDMWASLMRVCTDNCQFIFYCNTKFGHELIKSKESWFRYDLVWAKQHSTGWLCAKKKPMTNHEMVYIFNHSNQNDAHNNPEGRAYFRKVLQFINEPTKNLIHKKLGHYGATHCLTPDGLQFSAPTEETYNDLILHYHIDQMDGFLPLAGVGKNNITRPGHPTFNVVKRVGTFDNYKTGGTGIRDKIYGKPHVATECKDGSRYSRSCEIYPSDKEKYHPTQKPQSMLRYLVETYSNKGDLVLDFTCGSGSTLVAARDLGRNYIGVEKEEEYFKIATTRLQQKTSGLKESEGGV